MKEYLINGKTYLLNIFEKIETKEQAYTIGYLAGEGVYMTHTHKRKARLFVSSIEKDIIESIQQLFCPTTAIAERFPANKTRSEIVAKHMSYSLTFSSRFLETFNRYGILAKKNERILVNVPKKYMKYYLLGLFDADGHISFGHRRDRNRFWANFGITHQSYDILTKIQNFLENELEVSSSVRPRKDEKCLDLKFSKLSSVEKVMDWLYSDLPDFYSDKNYQRYLTFKGKLHLPCAT